MMKVSLIAAIGLSVASSASADFLGFDGTLSTNSNGDNVVQMFAVFDNSNTIGLNVFNADISASSDFNHSDVQVAAGGTWNPTASLDIPGFADSANDSYVTMGYGVGAAAALNGTALDPGFAPTGGLGGTIPVGAGWYNGNPTNEQGVSAFGGGLDGISGYALMIGQFVWNGANDVDGAFVFTAEMGSNTGAGTDVDFGFDTFEIPAPGALALLGLGGLATRRRRG